MSSDKAVSYAIVIAGGFLGVAKHDVPVSKFKLVDNKLVLAGAMDALGASPPFEYAR